jgi:hypothetical protein
MKFAVEQMRNVQPNADYDDLTLVGHSVGADISMYFPEQTKKVVTLDNLCVPFVINGRFKILSFRSKDPIFKTDSGVIPPEEVRKKAGVDVIQTDFRHNDMRDTGPDQARESIQGVLDIFIEDETPLKPVEPIAAKPDLTDVGPVAPYVPVAPTAKVNTNAHSTSSATLAERQSVRDSRVGSSARQNNVLA